MRLSIEQRDLEVKTSKIKEFLEKGHKVKITVMLKGREMAFLDRAYEFLKKIEGNLGENIRREKEPQRLGNRISLVLAKK